MKNIYNYALIPEIGYRTVIKLGGLSRKEKKKKRYKKNQYIDLMFISLLL